MAENVSEALRKAKKLPVHEIYVHGAWFDKANNYEFFPDKLKQIGFTKETSKDKV